MYPAERPTPNHIPSFNDVNAAYLDIIKHNEKHTGLGSALGGLFRALVPQEGQEGIDPQSIDGALEQGVVEGDMDAELQDIFHSDTFLRIGMKIAPFGSHIANGLGERVSSTSLIPVINNTELFKEFLTTLKPEEIELNREHLLLPAAISNLKRLISLCFDPSQRQAIPEELHEVMQEYGENALRTFVAIEPEYKRLGLDSESLQRKFPHLPEDPQARKSYDVASSAAKVFDTLDKYVSYWGRDVLPEFIVADYGQYLKPPEEQGFGPAQWHHDGGQRRWWTALEFVDQLSSEQRTKDFGEEVREGLLLSLKAAIAEIDNAKEPPYFANHRPDLINIQNALSGHQYDAEVLTKYTQEPNYDL